jgi:hypothetical protein
LPAAAVLLPLRLPARANQAGAAVRPPELQQRSLGCA